ncbi:MAG: serine hydroxymethyltransferase, partial [Bacteroidales bacterium]|nr:serine hydroxymethyltransferase [Bacteroidales bacterium]
KLPEITERQVEDVLGKANITLNKNMVPFDSRSPFQTAGLRIGTPAITTRGLKEEHMEPIVELIDRVISDHENEKTINEAKAEVNKMMMQFPLFAD